MTVAEVPRDEAARLAALYSYNLLDTIAEETFDDVCRLASAICETPISLISLLDRHRQWFKAVVGLDVRETPRERCLCAHAILEDDMLVVEDALKDIRFADAPLVIAKPKIRFYAGQPLWSRDGYKIGTLCVIDQVPRQLTAHQKQALRVLGRQLETQIELRRLNHDMAQLEAGREMLLQFAAHDAASPLLVIQMLAAELSSGMPVTPERVRELSTELHAAADSVIQLSANLRDIGVNRANRLAPRWQRVSMPALADAARGTVSPKLREKGITLKLEVEANLEVDADPDLLARLLLNLLFNSIDHSPQDSTITLQVAREPGAERYSITVEDEGLGIPESQHQQIFDMYASATAEDSRGRASRGIGLAFCHAAAQCHHGTIKLSSRSPHGCVFRASLPIHRPTQP